MENRRYDIDWIRILAIGLLLMYHTAIGFQSWGLLFGFITNTTKWESLWVPMTILNIWRIPILFFVSGVSVYYSFRNRNWKQLLGERTIRILIPFLFGCLVLVPVYCFILQNYYHWPLQYRPDSGHLWFLGNIIIYIVLLLPLLQYLKQGKENKLRSALKKMFSKPWGLLVVSIFFMAEAILADPGVYELYAQNLHGFFLGLPAFFFGYCFAISGPSLWNMLVRWRWIFLSTALILFILRTLQLQPLSHNIVLPVESNLWVYAIFGFAYMHLNKPGRIVSYLSRAAYPVYIVHMIWISVFSSLIFPLQWNAQMTFLFVLAMVFLASLMSYELFIRRLKWLRLLFGVKNEQAKRESASSGM